jgi:hypothetical protein
MPRQRDAILVAADRRRIDMDPGDGAAHLVDHGGEIALELVD